MFGVKFCEPSFVVNGEKKRKVMMMRAGIWDGGELEVRGYGGKCERKM